MLLVAIYVAAVIIVPPIVDRVVTAVFGGRPFDDASSRAQALHKTLFVADLHADSLIWPRNLNERNEHAQVDLPRLREGNVALQVFSVPTQVPKERSRSTRRNQLDLLTVAAFTQAWPPTTWFRRDSRAEHAAKILHRAAQKSDGALKIIRTKNDLRQLVERRNAIGGLLALEGMHALEGDVQNVDELFDAGYRMGGLVHQFDNELGGSSQGVARGALSAFGAEVVHRMEERSMIVDLAHASPILIRDVLAVAKKPVVVSHTGVQGTCNRPRNLSDDELRRIAKNGGVIGIGFWMGATCGSKPADVARAIRHAVNVAGIDHVSLGSDFDGDRMPFDATGLVRITDALLAEGFSEAEIRKIMGGNTVRLLMNGLPE